MNITVTCQRLSLLNTEVYLTTENCQLHHVETPVKDTQISGTPLDSAVGYTSCGPQGIQATDTPDLSDVCDITMYVQNVGTFFHRPRITYTRENLFNCNICGAIFTAAGSLKHHLRKIHTEEKAYKRKTGAASYCGLLSEVPQEHSCMR